MNTADKKMCRECGAEIVNGVNGCMLKGNICNACNPGLYYLAPPRQGVSYSESDGYALAGRVIRDTD
jgi:hypothetical protein